MKFYYIFLYFII